MVHASRSIPFSKRKELSKLSSRKGKVFKGKEGAKKKKKKEKKKLLAKNPLFRGVLPSNRKRTMGLFSGLTRKFQVGQLKVILLGK